MRLILDLKDSTISAVRRTEYGIIKNTIKDTVSFQFRIVNFPFSDWNVPLSSSYLEYISKTVPFALVSNDVLYLNERSLCITSKLLNFVSISKLKRLQNYIIHLKI